MTGYDPCRVSPFGYLRINGCLRLPEAFRSLPRPSSLPRAKASTLRPLLLDFYFRLPAKHPFGKKETAVLQKNRSLPLLLSTAVCKLGIRKRFAACQRSA